MTDKPRKNMEPQSIPESILNQSLLPTTLSPPLKTAISTHLWCGSWRKVPPSSIGYSQARPLDAYWAYYTKECTNALHNSGRHIASRTHADVASCASQIRLGATREQVKGSLRRKLTAHTHPNEEEMLENAVDLATSLLTMIRFGGYYEMYGFSGWGSRLCWGSCENGSSSSGVGDSERGVFSASLREFLASHFAPENNRLGRESVKLERIFKGCNLERVAGLEIVWTDNLADHLRLVDDDRKVNVFYCAEWLEVQRDSLDSLLPDGLAEETLRTLALLFPARDTETKSWMASLPATSPVHLDRQTGHCGRLHSDDRRIDRFAFWRDRLVMLKQAFDEAQPKTIRQWWYDSRNGVQWYTFWVAVLVLVLTVVFGLVQSIEGALQVYVSFKALDGEGGGHAGNS